MAEGKTKNAKWAQSESSQAQQNWKKKKRTIFFAEGLEHVVSPTIARVKH